MSAVKDKTAGLTTRQKLLAGGLGLSVAASLWVAQIEDEAPVAAVAGARRADTTSPSRPRDEARRPASARAQDAAASSASVDWRPLERAPWPEASDAQLAAWQPPPPPAPPPPPPPAPPPPPVAPPLPYQMIGRLEEQGVVSALLATAQATRAVRVGDVIDGQWRVDQISDRGLSLTWLPGKLPQTLSYRSLP